MGNFVMPSLGADMEAGTLVEWHFQPGDSVKRGDIIADVETDKGVIEIEVFEDGILQEILVEVDTEVPVGTVLAVINTTGAEEPAVATAGSAVEAVQPTSALKKNAADEHHPMDHRPLLKSTPPQVNGNGHQRRIKATPLAKRIAKDLGVDLSTLTGTGPHGVISKEDVLLAADKPAPCAPQPAPKPAPPPAKKAARADNFGQAMRRAIAAAMSRSNQDVPHYYLDTRLDMSRPLAWLETENNQRSMKDRILPAVLFIKAVGQALVDVPQLNGFWKNDQFEPQEGIHIGFAIALRQGGLVTPAIHNVDLKSHDELMVDLRDLIMRTRAGRLRSSELTDATITLTNLGDLGVETVFGVIYPPQVALVGIGKVIEQPWVENGMLGIRPIVKATLAGDHRATDGRTGAQFLEALNRHLQEINPQ